MEKKTLKPSDLQNVHPWSSVDHNSECEHSMAWMVEKLQENGDEFREVPYEEYKQWGGIRDAKEFKPFQKYLKSADTIVLYSDKYQEAADKLNAKNH